MNITVIKSQRIAQMNPNTGTYKGLWSGYTIKMNDGFGDYLLTTSDGVRGVNIPVIITITADGNIKVELAQS